MSTVARVNQGNFSLVAVDKLNVLAWSILIATQWSQIK